VESSTNNAASTGSKKPKSNGRKKSTPSAVTAAPNPKAGPPASPRSDLAEQQVIDTLQVAAGSPAGSTPLIQPPDFEVKFAAATLAAQMDVIDQLMYDTVEEKLENRLEGLAAKWGTTPERLVELATSDPEWTQAVAASCADDVSKSNFFETESFEFCKQLESSDASPVKMTDRLPTKGPDAMYLTTKGVFFGDEPASKKSLCKSMDIVTLVDTKSGPALVVQYHKYTRGTQGGTQNLTFDDMSDFVRGATRAKLTESRAPRAIDATGTMYPVYFAAVVDGSFWSKQKIKELARHGKVAKTITPGGLYICSTADLPELFESISKV
jgi:hypothetical protein